MNKESREWWKLILCILGLIFLALLLAGCPNPQPPTPPGPVDPPIPPVIEPVPTVKVFVGVYDLLCASGDVDKYLADCKAAGATGVRIFADCQWNNPGTRPYEYAAYDEATAEKIRYKDPADPKRIENDGGIMVLVRDSGARFPLFDYTRPRAAYWNYLRDVLTACKGHGLTAWVVMLDYCTLKTPGDAKYYSPWACAVQRMLPGITDGTWGAPMRPWVAAFFRQVLTVIEEVGVGYLVESQNESNCLGWPADFALAWHGWAVDTIRAYGVPSERIIASSELPAAPIAAQVGLYSPHGIGRPDQIVEIPGVPNYKIVFSSDGFWNGAGPADGKGRRGPGLDVANAIGLKVIALGAYGFEYLPRDAYISNGDRANVDGLDLSVVKAIAFAK